MKRIKFSTNNLTNSRTFIVSDIDFVDIVRYNWRLDFCSRGHYRVVRDATQDEIAMGFPRIIKLHRFIMGLFEIGSGGIVDHINGNTLDNRRENLRIVSHKENMNNRCDNIKKS